MTKARKTPTPEPAPKALAKVKSAKRADSQLGPALKGKLTYMEHAPTTLAEARALWKQNTPEAWNLLLDLMADRKTPRKLRSEIAFGILDRGWGKPQTHIDIRADIRARYELSDEDLLSIATTTPIDPRELPPRLRNDPDAVFEVDPVTGEAKRVQVKMPEKKR